MTFFSVGELKQKLAEKNAFDAELQNAVVGGEIPLDEIPEAFVTSNIVISALLVNVKNYFKIPVLYKTREMCLLMAQLDSSLYRDLEGKRLLPVEIHSWVSSSLSTPILSHFPIQARSKEFCVKAISLSAKNVQFLPENFLESQGFIEELVCISPSVLKYLDEKIIDESLCELAFNQEGFDLEYIPQRLRTSEFCLKAFDKNYSAIYSIPSEFLTLNLILKAIKLARNQELERIVDITPNELKTYDFWINIAEKDSSILRLVPENIIDDHFAYIMANSIKRASHLRYIPQNLIVTPVVLNALIDNDPMLLEGVPSNFRDYMLCMSAVEKNGLSLQFVPIKMHDSRLYMAAITQNPLAMKHIPVPYIDENLPRIAIAKNGEAIEYVKESYIDEELCRMAIENNPRALYFLPEKFRNDYALNLLAMKTEGSTLDMINERYRTTELCRIALRSSYKNWKHIPLNVRSDAEIISLYNTYSKQGFLKE